MVLMGEIIRGFIAWLLSDNTSASTTYGNPDLHPIDTDQLAKELDLERQAELLGQRDIPRTDDTSLTGIESKIIQVIEKARQEYADWGSQRARLLNATVNHTDITPVALRALHLDSEFERKAGALLNEWSSTLKRLTLETQDRNEEYARFQTTHGLTNAAKIPSQWEKRFRLMILGFLILVEGGLNSVFFAQGMWGGLLDGLFYALIFAFINILLAYCYGRFFLPQLFHRQIVYKILGAVFLIVAFILIVALALLIAHYRDAVSSGASEAAAHIALETFRSNLLELRDIQSVLLCVVSIGFALGAAYDSFGLDDPYPGYGNVTRRRNQSIDDFALEIGLVREHLEALKVESLKELETHIDDMRVALHQLDQAILQKGETDTKLNNTFTNVDNCLDALLHRFRTSNKMHRKTKAPDYFSKGVTLRPVTRPDFNIAADQAKNQTQRLKLQEVESSTPRIRANIQSSYSRFFDSLKPLDDHFATVLEQK